MEMRDRDVSVTLPHRDAERGDPYRRILVHNPTGCKVEVSSLTYDDARVEAEEELRKLVEPINATTLIEEAAGSVPH